MKRIAVIAAVALAIAVSVVLYLNARVDPGDLSAAQQKDLSEIYARSKAYSGRATNFSQINGYVAGRPNVYVGGKHYVKYGTDWMEVRN